MKTMARRTALRSRDTQSRVTIAESISRLALFWATEICVGGNLFDVRVGQRLCSSKSALMWRGRDAPAWSFYICETVRRILSRMAVAHPQPSPPWGRGLKFQNPARHFLVRVRLLIRNVETPGVGGTPTLRFRRFQHRWGEARQLRGRTRVEPPEHHHARPDPQDARGENIS
jgi:hypothetical protein